MKSWWLPLKDNNDDDGGYDGAEANPKPARAAPPAAPSREHLDTSNVLPQESGPALPKGTKSGRDYSEKHRGCDLRDVEPPQSLLAQPQIRILLVIEGIFSVRVCFLMTGATVGGGYDAIIVTPRVESQSWLRKEIFEFEWFAPKTGLQYLTGQNYSD